MRMKVFAARNADDMIRRESSAGGVFTQLAEQVIAEGGVVYGAAFDTSWNVTHCRVDNITDLSKLRGSKYVFSNFASAISDAVNDLNDGHKVLFSGTPCQVAAMSRRTGENPNLLLVEVVCHGAPEAKYWTRYLKELCLKKNKEISDIQSINFRDKRTGWKNYSFTVTFKDGKCFSEPHDDNLYMRAFLADLTIRNACFNCHFKYPRGSRADITIGDFWGISQLAPEIDNDYGTSCVIFRTSVGYSAVSSLTRLKEIPFDDAVKFNPAIISSPEKPLGMGNFLENISEHGSVLKAMSRYASKPLSLKLKTLIYRLFH